jgi:hypothetical protein
VVVVDDIDVDMLATEMFPDAHVLRHNLLGELHSLIF